jgi:hypothetical protein
VEREEDKSIIAMENNISGDEQERLEGGCVNCKRQSNWWKWRKSAG